MLEQLVQFDQALANKLPGDVDIKDLFVPVGDLDVGSSLELYKTNQREGKYKTLQKFYQQTEKIIGKERFRAIALGFIRRYPSQTFTLSAFHPDFPGFAAANVDEEQKKLVRDLARFEWAWHRLGRREFINQSPSIREDMAKCTPDKLKFSVSPTARVERFDYRINEVYRKLKADEEVDFAEGRHFVLFWRPDPTIKKRMALSLWQAHLVKLMQKNADLAQALYNINSHSKVDPSTVSEFLDKMITEKVFIRARS